MQGRDSKDPGVDVCAIERKSGENVAPHLEAGGFFARWHREAGYSEEVMKETEFHGSGCGCC